jgi:hypothetical protein
MNNMEHPPPQPGGPEQLNPGAHIETLGGRQELVIPGRFELSWDLAAANALEPEQLDEFREAVTALLAYGDAVASNDPDRAAAAEVDRHGQMLNISAVLRVPGSSIAYTNRNTRYTSMDGVHIRAEEIVPGRPMDEQNPRGGIRNTLNIPDTDISH